MDECSLPQSYEYAAVMKGYDKGLHILFKNINKYAEYVLCTAHSLTLVKKKAPSTVPEFVDVSILQP